MWYLSLPVEHSDLSVNPVSGSLDLTDVPSPPDGGSHHGVEVGHEGQGQEVLKDAESQAVVVESGVHVCNGRYYGHYC